MSGSGTILHIGGQKCGSSAIQGYFFFGRYALSNQKVRYLDPELGTDLGLSRSHSELLSDLRTGGEEWVRERLSRLDWSDPDCRYVLSSEGFCQIARLAQHSAALRPLAEFGPVQIVFYVRPQAEVLYGGWQQWGLASDFDDWIDHALSTDFANWNTVLAAWRAAFPDAQIIVRTFSRNLFPEGDVVADICGALAMPRVEMAARRAANPTYDDLTTLAVKDLAICSGIAPLTLMRSIKRAALPLPAGSGNLVMKDETYDRIVAHYALSNAEFMQAAELDAQSIAALGARRIPAMSRIPSDGIEMRMNLLRDTITGHGGMEEVLRC